MKPASEGECVAIRKRNRKKKSMKKSNRTRLDIEKKEGRDFFDRDSFDRLELRIMKKKGLKLRGSHTITQLDLMSRIMKITRSCLFINLFYRAWGFRPKNTPSINRQNER